MSGDFSQQRDGTDHSFVGCLGVGTALVVLFGIICAGGGYWVAIRFAQVEPKPAAAQPALQGGDLPPNKEGPDAPAGIKSKNQLRKIMLAMHTHHSQFRAFPPPANASFDDNGKPLLSWRVHLLPFLNEQPLYEMFHHDEPWDSDHNRMLVDRMPDVYRSRGVDANGNRTGFVLFQDPEMYSVDKRGPFIPSFVDGTSKTLLVLEVGQQLAVPWTRPEDLSFDPNDPLAAVGKPPKDGLWGGFADGAVRRIKAEIEPAVFRGILTFNGGEDLQLERQVEAP
jgi:hypothetical protein